MNFLRLPSLAHLAILAVLLTHTACFDMGKPRTTVISDPSRSSASTDDGSGTTTSPGGPDVGGSAPLAGAPSITNETTKRKLPQRSFSGGGQ